MGLLTEKNVYSIEVSFTQNVTGEAFADTEDEVRERLTKEFEDAPDFKILKIEKVGDASQLAMDFNSTLN